MARILTAGAEEGNLRALADMASVIGGVGKIVDITTGVPPRTGEYCYQVVSAGNYAFGLQFPQSVGLSEVYIGFAFYPTGIGGASTTYNNYWNTGVAFFNAPFMYFALAGSGLGAFYSSAQIGAYAACTINAWHYLEIHYIPNNSASGTLQTKLDGVTWLNVTGARTAQNAGSDVGPLVFGGNNGTVYYDDIVINSVSGGAAVNQTWPGQVRLFPIRMKAAGDQNDFSRGGFDLGFNEAQVRDAGSGISWLYSGTANQIQRITMDAPQLPAGSSIVQVHEEIHCRAQAGGSNITPELKSDTTANLGTSTPIGTSWQTVMSQWVTNPADSAAWEQADLATIQLGVKLA